MPKPIPIPNLGGPPKPEHPPVDAGRVATPPVASPRPSRSDNPKVPKDRANSVQHEKHFRDSGESDILKEVVKNVSGMNYNQALAGLDTWSRRYRSSDFSDERTYYYMQAYTGLNQPAKAVDAGTPLLSKDLSTALQDPMQVIGVLYLASFNLQRLQEPTTQQITTGKTAAYGLLQYLPVYFTPQNRPPTVSSDDWTRARTDLEALARQTLAFAERPSARH